MARTGKFGRLPRPGANLTNTIVAIEQQFQAAQDRNVMDAWKNGGTVLDPATKTEVPATDEYVIAYWQNRLQGISKKDPLYDQYQNTIQQFEYAVAESKNSLLYAQGKITDAERAQFFLDWAKKIDPNTEFYRTLQRNAAQFLERIKATSRAASSGSRSAASAAASTQTAQNYEVAGSYITEMLTQYARDNGFIGRTEDLSKLSFGTRDGAGRMIDLINRLNADRPSWVAVLSQVDPSFSGTLTYDYYQQALAKQMEGLRLRYQQAVSEGRMGTVNGVPGATALKNQMDDLAAANSLSGMWDSAQTYLQLRKNFLAVWQDGTASPVEKVQAWNTYRNGLLNLANDPANPVDGETAAALTGEANLDPSLDTWFENFTRNTSVGASATSSDNADTRKDVQTFLAEYAAVNDGTGQYVWTYGERDSNGIFQPKAGGTIIGATTLIKATQANARAVIVPQADGSTITVYTAPVPVVAVAQNADGAPLAAVNPDGTKANSTVGQALDVWYGGTLVRVYGYRATDGTMRYTTVPPWGGGVTETIDPKTGAVIVDVTAAVNAGKGAYTPTIGGGTTGFTPSLASADTVRNNAGINESMDFLSPMMAAMQATDDGRAKLANLANDPQLRTVLEQDALRYLVNPAGQVDVKAWNTFTAQLDRLSRPLTFKGPTGGTTGFDYNNATNQNVFADVPITVQTIEAKGYDRASGNVTNVAFGPLATTMMVPGRFGQAFDPVTGLPLNPDVYDQRQGMQAGGGVRIISPTQLVVPQPPQESLIAPGQATTTGPAPGVYDLPPVPVEAPPPPPPPTYDSSTLVQPDQPLYPAPSPSQDVGGTAPAGSYTYVPGGVRGA